MGKRGPKPTPTAILKVRGSWRAKAREKAGEVRPEPIEGHKSRRSPAASTRSPVPKPPVAGRRRRDAGPTLETGNWEPGTPRPPAALRNRGKAMWRDTYARLVKLRVLTELDLDRLLSMCKAWDDYWAADAEVQKHGIVIVTLSEKGHEKRGQNPAVLERHRAWQRYKTESDGFGLTPSSRTKVTESSAAPAVETGKSRFFNPKVG